MKRLLLLSLLGAFACDRAPQEAASQPPSAPPVDAQAVEALQSKGPQSKAPLVLPMPKDQAELDRMILAGYTPHGSHLHPPGVKNCPLAKEGNEAVM